ncbi:heparin lyase I family protein [Hyalangium minutum]|uniref:F5/8 type C domain protein n=1 Tax=Hyalangium minutum TaxID=394096 RepID=A0A085VZN7_9BACT|nr:heparin lyase I family protein [Hyalangium minutum]KFE60900.1 F5/8 type C domain protein [Hyalangium minutum]
MKNVFLLVGTLLTIGTVACGPQDPLSDEVPGLLTSTESELSASNCTQLTPTSVIVSGSESSNPGTNALDNNLDTRWSNLGKGSFIDFDLGSEKSVSGAAIAWHLGTTQINNFLLQTTLDGINYTQVYSGRNSATLAAETYTFPARTARRLRISVLGNNLNNWASIAEARPCAGSVSTPPAASVVWRGDFETGNLTQWTREQEVSADRLQIVTSPVRQGGYALKATVKQGDDPIDASGNRNEMVRLTYEPANSEYYYRWSTMFPSDFPSPATWQLFTQWHHTGSSGSPPVEFAVNNGNIILYCRSTEVWRTPLVRGVWNDFVFHVKWSPSSSTGFVELYHQGRLVLPKRYCATQFSGQVNYLKVGLYRNSSISQTGVVYHDNWLMGRSLSDVMP